MFTGRQAQALQIYRQLHDQGHYDFSTPGSLPEIPSLSRDHRFSREWQAFNLSADVSTRGSLRNIVLSEVGLRDATLLGFAKRQLRAMRFRPALTETGEAIEASIAWDIKVLR